MGPQFFSRKNKISFILRWQMFLKFFFLAALLVWFNVWQYYAVQCFVQRVSPPLKKFFILLEHFGDLVESKRLSQRKYS